MTFDTGRAIGAALRRQYLPPTLPPPFVNPVEFSMQSDFTQGPNFDYDPARSDNTLHWSQAQRYVCPKRPFGADILDSEHDASVMPSSGLPNGWENASIGGGTINVFNHTDTDTAVSGPCFKLETNAVAGAVAAMRRTVPAVPVDRFSMMLMTRINKGYPWIDQLSSNPADAAYVILTNSEGASLVTRYYKSHGEIFCGDFYAPEGHRGHEWRLFAGHVDDFFWECWPEAKKLGPGAYDVTVRAGTTVVGHWIGGLPFNFNGLGPNKLQFHQESGGGVNYRKFDVRTFNIGTRQTAADCSITSMPLLTSQAVGSAQIAVMLGDTSGDLKIGQPDTRINEAFQLWASANNGTTWTQVMITYAEPAGYDVIDPTKVAYVMGGRVALSSGDVGNSLRWCVKFRNEYFGTLQGVQMIGFPA